MSGEHRREWRVTFGGRAFRISLRSTDDGFISGAEFEAVVLLLDQFRTTGIGIGDPKAVDRFFNLITNEGFSGMIEDAETSAKIPLPFASWIDLPFDVLQEIQDSFFFCLRKKMNRLQSLNSAIPTTMTDMMTTLHRIFTNRTQSDTTSS